METLQDRLQREAELAVFWDEIAQNLPKNIERSALGDEKIFNAFAIAYPKIRQYIVSETIKAERAEWLRSEIEELEKRKFNVVDWLRNTYGLDDDDCLSAGRVQELCEMLVPDAFTSIITRYKEELKVLTGEYE